LLTDHETTNSSDIWSLNSVANFFAMGSNFDL
jgi:hypothetical protein